MKITLSEGLILNNCMKDERKRTKKLSPQWFDSYEWKADNLGLQHKSTIY